MRGKGTAPPILVMNSSCWKLSQLMKIMKQPSSSSCTRVSSSGGGGVTKDMATLASRFVSTARLLLLGVGLFVHCLVKAVHSVTVLSVCGLQFLALVSLMGFLMNLDILIVVFTLVFGFTAYLVFISIRLAIPLIGAPAYAAQNLLILSSDLLVTLAGCDNGVVWLLAAAKCGFVASVVSLVNSYVHWLVFVYLYLSVSGADIILAYCDHLT